MKAEKVQFKDTKGNIVPSTEKHELVSLKLSMRDSNTRNTFGTQNLYDLGKKFKQDAYFRATIEVSNEVSEINRKYMSILDVFGLLGGLITSMSVFFYTIYRFYNYISLRRYIVQNYVLGGSLLAQHSEQYNVNNDYFKVKFQHSFCCCKERVLRNVEKSTEKYITIKASEALIQQKLQLNNYLQDTLDLDCMRNMMMKSRHRLLVPILALNLLSQKKKTIAHKTSFFKNLHDRTDKPLFTITEAIEEILDGENKDGTVTNRNSLEEQMDNFFITYLPNDMVNNVREKYAKKQAEFGSDEKEYKKKNRNYSSNKITPSEQNKQKKTKTIGDFNIDRQKYDDLKEKERQAAIKQKEYDRDRRASGIKENLQRKGTQRRDSTAGRKKSIYEVGAIPDWKRSDLNQQNGLHENGKMGEHINSEYLALTNDGKKENNGNVISMTNGANKNELKNTGLTDIPHKGKDVNIFSSSEDTKKDDRNGMLMSGFTNNTQEKDEIGEVDCEVQSDKSDADAKSFDSISDPAPNRVEEL